MIAVDDVSKFYGSVVAVSEVSFAIDQGVTALLGPNGAGKSTLFRMLCGLTPTSRGTLRVLGEDPRRNRDVRGSIGLVPQQDALFDHLTATEFVSVAARTQGIDAADIDRVAHWALEQVDLHDVGTKPVGQFSKGMRQRVKVAAALVNDHACPGARRTAHRAGPGAAPSDDRAVPSSRRRRPLRAGVEPRARRGRPARVERARRRAGAPRRQRRLPRACGA